MSSWHSTASSWGARGAAGDHNRCPSSVTVFVSIAGQLTAGSTDAGWDVTAGVHVNHANHGHGYWFVEQAALGIPSHARHLMEQPMLGRCGSGTAS